MLKAQDEVEGSNCFQLFFLCTYILVSLNTQAVVLSSINCI